MVSMGVKAPALGVESAGDYRARTGSCRQFKGTRNLRKRRLLRFAHRDAADAKKSALLGCFGNVLADLAQPALEGGRVAGRLGIDYSASLPQRLDAPGFDLGGLAACELLPQAVARGASPFGSLKVGDDRFDQRVQPGVHLGCHQRVAAGELSFKRPHRPLGSAAKTAIPATITLSRRSFHSSGVKFDLSGMG